jgi:CBS domain-containing protein
MTGDRGYVRAETRSVGVVSTVSHVWSLVSRPAVSVDEAASLGEAAAAMREAGTSSVLVGDGSRILTERDVVRAFEAGLGVDDLVSGVASTCQLRVSGDVSIVDAAARMLNEDVRHLVVDIGPGLVGVISLRAIVAVLLQEADPQLWLSSLRIAVEVPEMWLG